jgi:phosphoglycerol transferase MdoB-like AlkP superfamily enzyme
VSDQILLAWAKEGMRGPRPGHAGRDPVALHAELRGDVERSRATLLAFREYGAKGGALPVVSAPGGPSLVREIAPGADETRALRERLGLEGDEAPNVILLFLESVRSFEIDHPELGPLIFPRLRKVLEEHAIYFPQAYSSAAGAGLTVRGQFSSLCSGLPDMLGPPTYLTRYDIGLTCLPALLRSNGYRTFWISSQDSGFHNKALFERAHGTDTIYDAKHFEGRGLEHNVGTCGFADGPFLQEYLRELERLDDGSEPFFVNTLTISTHAPHTPIPKGVVPAELSQATNMDPRYAGYLSRLSYVDGALADFFKAFFRSRIADHTVILMVGDHSFNVSPHIHLEPWQQVELLGRVPLALVTAFGKAERIERPVHQADIAPTLASIAGARGKAAWIGRGLFASEGTPWVFAPSIEHVSDRVGDQGCYASSVQSERSCYDLSGGRDPLFSAELGASREDPERLAFFTEVVEANHQLITENRLEPD